MPPRVAKPTKSAEPAAVAPTPSAKPAKASAMAPAKAAAKTATPPASAKGAKGKAVAVAEPVQPKAAASAPVAVTPITPATGGDSTPRRKSRNVDDEDKTTSELIKEFGKAIRKRIGAGNFADVDGKDVRSVVRLLNQIRKDATPKPKGDRAPMNAFFYYQALRHLQVKKNGGPSAKEAERIKQLTDAQPEDKPLAPYMILSKLFNEDEYKKFDAKKKSELDATAKGFSLFRSEKYPGELEDKNKPLADWVALKEAERVAYEKRAKQLANEKHATAAAEKEASKKAKEESKALKTATKAAKKEARAAERAAKDAAKAAASAAVTTVA